MPPFTTDAPALEPALMGRRFGAYVDTLRHLLRSAAASDGGGRPIEIGDCFARLGEIARRTHAQGNKLMFVGNGGSAGIASHLAIDFTKNGGMRALAFYDGAALTCLGNDLGYENVFAKQIEMHARAGDLLFAISSSGQSENILGAVAAARGAEVTVVTLSGFAPDNPLRALGDFNLYLASAEYGFVEVGHLALLHALLDLLMGWNADLKEKATA